MMNFKKQIIIAFVVFLFLAVLAFIFYRKGKKTVTLQSLPGELPGNVSSGNQTGASNDEIKNIANALYSDMNGFNASGHDYTPYKQASLLNDSDLVKLYNTFNTLYQKQSSQTLTQWLSSEYYYSGALPILLYDRLKKLNCA